MVLGGAAAFLAIAGFVLWVALNPPPELGPDGCPLDEGEISENLVFVFDTTEPYIPAQMREIRNRVEGIVRELRPLGRVSAWAIRSDRSSALNPVPVTRGGALGFCRRRDSMLDPGIVTELNDRMLRELREMVGNVPQEEQAASRITDGLRYVAADVTGKPYRSTVHVFSDMIENSETLSMYADGWFEDRFEADRAVILAQRPIFPPGTGLHLYVLERPRHRIDGSEVRQYWLRMLSREDIGLAPVFTRISGGL